MTLRNFLKLYQESFATISIHLLPYDEEKNEYKKSYFSEVKKEELKEYEIFKAIKNKQVHHFSVDGGGIYSVELCIYLSSSENKMCGDFKCIHQQYGICNFNDEECKDEICVNYGDGICNFDDEKCEGEVCVNYGDCGQCLYGGTGCSAEY